MFDLHVLLLSEIKQKNSIQPYNFWNDELTLFLFHVCIWNVNLVIAFLIYNIALTRLGNVEAACSKGKLPLGGKLISQICILVIVNVLLFARHFCKSMKLQGETVMSLHYVKAGL